VDRVLPLLPEGYGQVAANLQAIAAGELPSLPALLSEPRLAAALLHLLTGETVRRAGERFGVKRSIVGAAMTDLPRDFKQQLRSISAPARAAAAAATDAAASDASRRRFSAAVGMVLPHLPEEGCEGVAAGLQALAAAPELPTLNPALCETRLAAALLRQLLLRLHAGQRLRLASSESLFGVPPPRLSRALLRLPPVVKSRVRQLAAEAMAARVVLPDPEAVLQGAGGSLGGRGTLALLNWTHSHQNVSSSDGSSGSRCVCAMRAGSCACAPLHSWRQLPAMLHTVACRTPMLLHCRHGRAHQRQQWQQRRHAIANSSSSSCGGSAGCGEPH
jgi:hypothetical protein